jgi:dipeptidyl aminopeptidase/acylaminoacyl peptidase
VLLGVYLLLAFALVYGATRAERNPFEAHPHDFGLRFEEVSFEPRDGELTLRGWFLEGSAGAPHLIFVHGIGDQRTGNRSLELAARLVKDAGYNVLVFDLRAQGTSDGDIVTAGEFEQDDVLGAYDYLLSQGATPGRIGLIGRSYGAAIAIMAASREPGIAAVVADSPFADVQDLLAQETARKTPMPKWLVSFFMPPARLFADLLYDIHLGDLKPEKDVAQLQYPVLIIHGETDERIPVEQGRRVYEAAPAGSELWILPEVEHADGFPEQPDEYVRRVTMYLIARFGLSESASSLASRVS